MIPVNPRTDLKTHDVFNQAPPMADINLFETDTCLVEAIEREGAGQHRHALSAFGKRVGTAEVYEWGFEANRNTPQLKTFDRTGQRIDEVTFHPAYHNLLGLGISHGVSSFAWLTKRGGHVAHTALHYLLGQVESSVNCPITMTYAAVPALRANPKLSAFWEPKILASTYDPASRPANEKAGVTIGMAMTEKQGGSDVRSNTTKAVPIGDGLYELTGHKWFCSAPMCDAFLTLAYTDEDRQTGLTCFLVPRWRPDGTRNQVHIMRLKDKLGDRANASSEIEYHGALAWPLGEIGRGIPTIIEMVQHTRLDCTNGAGLLMRQAVAQALWHVSHRSAFQRKLIDQPLMRQVLADLLLEVEAATALTFRIARSFDEKGTDETAGLFARIATPIGKYCVNKRVVPVVFEAMECLGGAGFVEESILPRIYRQSPLNSIWEGSGNVICLDVLRAMARSPDAVEVVLAEIAQAKGGSAAFDQAFDDLKERLRPEAITEQSARHLTEHFGLLLQASLLLRHTPAAIGETFAETRLGEGRGGASFGAFSKAVDADVIIERGSPLKAAA